jgi:RNA polymerase-binding transcription factor DksA
MKKQYLIVGAALVLMGQGCSSADIEETAQKEIDAAAAQVEESVEEAAHEAVDSATEAATNAAKDAADQAVDAATESLSATVDSATEAAKEKAVDTLEKIAEGVQSIGDTITIDSVSHTVLTARTLDRIPASETEPEWEKIAKDLPAERGYQWVHLTGTIENTSGSVQSVNSNAVTITTDSGKTYKVSTDTTAYVAAGESLTYIEIDAGATAEWEAYIQVPEDEENIRAVVTDLKLLPDQKIEIDLGLE